jgi:hypothetical protein
VHNEHERANGDAESSRGDYTGSQSPLTVIASSCTTNACPTIYAGKAGDTLIFQGYEVEPNRAGVNLASDERLVEVPIDLLRQVAHLLT